MEAIQSMNESVMIIFKGVVKQYPGHRIAYPDISFEKGKSYLVLGASGSGKSTLLNMIAGVAQANEGKIIINGVDICKEPQSVRDDIRTRQIGYIYQDFKLIEDMTAEDNIRVLEICGVETKNLDDITRDLGIEDKLKRRVRNLSGGEKQRVAIARALVKSPGIILADEPTGSLNFEIGDVIVKKLLECAGDKALIMVSHDIRLAGYFDVVIDLNSNELNRGGAFA